MEEIENPIEQVQEEVFEHGKHSAEPWIAKAALASAILAVFAALSSMLSGHHANEAMIEQIHASDRWSFYQAKSIKSNLLQMREEFTAPTDSQKTKQIEEKLLEYKKEQEEIAKEAKEKQEASEKNFKEHEIFARAVTLFQVAIAIAAVSIISNRKKFWYASLAFGLTGLGFLLQGFFSS